MKAIQFQNYELNSKIKKIKQLLRTKQETLVDFRDKGYSK